ncbi:MAG: hypothetical protein NUW37_07370 [Planctomycetes bacterium]|nr:hypothetical protein [Planctomycetota bacterium]
MFAARASTLLLFLLFCSSCATITSVLGYAGPERPQIRLQDRADGIKLGANAIEARAEKPITVLGAERLDSITTKPVALAGVVPTVPLVVQTVDWVPVPAGSQRREGSEAKMLRSLESIIGLRVPESISGWFSRRFGMEVVKPGTPVDSKLGLEVNVRVEYVERAGSLDFAYIDFFELRLVEYDEANANSLWKATLDGEALSNLHEFAFRIEDQVSICLEIIDKFMSRSERSWWFPLSRRGR